MPVRLTFRRFLKSYWHFWYSLHLRKKRSILPQGRTATTNFPCKSNLKIDCGRDAGPLRCHRGEISRLEIFITQVPAMP